MASDRYIVAPEHTAVRVTLWRAPHVQIDPTPHVFTDEIGVKEPAWTHSPNAVPISPQK